MGTRARAPHRAFPKAFLTPNQGFSPASARAVSGTCPEDPARRIRARGSFHAEFIADAEAEEEKRMVPRMV